ncbi:hypothetical protein [Nonomuraea sp. NPDC048916]|uniref:hypothetical protein n=1 Tax=Nonomuraea sp. NPDC048916 TaxID=3154232 RepID=UPI0033F31D72
MTASTDTSPAASSPDPRKDVSPQGRRVTVNLTSRANDALDRAADLTGLSRTDTINRALQVYAYIEEIVNAQGGTLYVREANQTELVQLRFV